MTPPATIWLICLWGLVFVLWAGLVVDQALMLRRIRRLEAYVRYLRGEL